MPKSEPNSADRRSVTSNGLDYEEPALHKKLKLNPETVLQADNNGGGAQVM